MRLSPREWPWDSQITVKENVVRPLCIKLPLIIGYVKHFDSKKTMSFKVNDNKLLKKYTKIWEKVSSLMNTEFDSEPIYGENDKFKKTTLKLFEDKVNTYFQGERVSKENAPYKCLPLIILHSVIRVSKKHYPQTLLEECKYEIRKNKMKNLINDNLDLSSPDNETDCDSDNAIDHESENESYD